MISVQESLECLPVPRPSISKRISHIFIPSIESILLEYCYWRVIRKYYRTNLQLMLVLFWKKTLHCDYQKDPWSKSFDTPAAIPEDSSGGRHQSLANSISPYLLREESLAALESTLRGVFSTTTTTMSLVFLDPPLGYLLTSRLYCVLRSEEVNACFTSIFLN